MVSGGRRIRYSGRGWQSRHEVVVVAAAADLQRSEGKYAGSGVGNWREERNAVEREKREMRERTNEDR